MDCFGLYDQLQFDWLHNFFSDSLLFVYLSRLIWKKLAKCKAFSDKVLCCSGLRLAHAWERTCSQHQNYRKPKRHITWFTVDSTHTVLAVLCFYNSLCLSMLHSFIYFTLFCCSMFDFRVVKQTYFSFLASFFLSITLSHSFFGINYCKTRHFHDVS